MKALRELFSRKEHESASLYEQLEQHRARLPEMTRQYNEADLICIELAAKYNSARTAMSPTSLGIGADLQRARWTRNAIKSAYRREEMRITNALAAITRPLIVEFNESCLQRMKDIGKHFREEHLETYRAVNDREYAVIKDNAQALEEAQDEIMKAIRNISSFQTRTLADLRAEIERYREKFDLLEFNVMSEKTVSLAALRMARNDRKPERTVSADGVNALTARVNALEKSL